MCCNVFYLLFILLQLKVQDALRKKERFHKEHEEVVELIWKKIYKN